MISVKSVDAHLNRLAQPVERVVLPIHAASGRCLREPLVAKRPAPPFDRVMMDGFAVKAAALRPGQRSFSIIGAVPAGAKPPPLEGAACAFEVMTGAMLPPGADCVVPVEECTVHGDTLEIEKGATLEPGQFIHPCGAEYPEGNVILTQGMLLHPAHLELAASEGCEALSVNTDIQVHLITTGDEIVEVGSTPLPWQIFGTHAVAIEAGFSTASDVRFHSRHVRDDLSGLVKAIDACGEAADIIILCGAMSKGRKDYGIQAMQQCGFEVAFHRVAQRPGHPMALASRGRSLLFGLPGNPLAVLFTFYRHVLPTIDRLRGCAPPENVKVAVADELPARPDATCFVPCRLEQGQAILSISHNSGDLQCLANTDGFVEIPPSNILQSNSEPVIFRPWR